jgi:hypothetical protein
LYLIILTSLNACNENSNDPIRSADTTKPTITIGNKNFIEFIQVPLEEAGAISFGPFRDNKITAQDDSGNVTLSIVDVRGLDKSHIKLNPDNSLSFHNISHDTNLGFSHLTLRATDNSGNYTDSELFFAIAASELRIPTDIKLGKTTTVKYSVMPDIDQVEITQPLKSTGISTSAYLANNELFISITASTNATTEEEKATSTLIIRSTKSEFASELEQTFHVRLLPNSQN